MQQVICRNGGMFRTTTNVTGDVAISLIVAKTENMLDIEKFKS